MTFASPSFSIRQLQYAVAVAEICAARRAKARQVLPNARVYSDTKTLLTAEASRSGSGLDFVDIATRSAGSRSKHFRSENSLIEYISCIRRHSDHR